MSSSSVKIALAYPNLMDNRQQYAVRDERIAAISDCLKSRGIDPVMFSRSHLPDSLNEFELVIAAGGDGTQLDVARRMTDPQNCRLFAIRLFPEYSVGYLCNLDFDVFIKKFITIDLNNLYQLHVDHITRLQCVIDGSPLPDPILNDVLFANRCPARASKYIFTFNGIREKHCSSGIWVATQSGSHGASKSAGTIPLDSSDVRGCVYCVREIGQRTILEPPSPHTHFSITGRFLPDNDSLSIQSLTYNHALFLDGGLKEYPLEITHNVSFRYHPASLKRMVLD